MKKKRPNTKRLIREIASNLAELQDAGAIYDFLYAVLTPREREEIALRWRLVQLLLMGLSQRTIAATLGVSLCKITRGARELKSGRSGFRKVLTRSIARRPKG